MKFFLKRREYRAYRYFRLGLIIATLITGPVMILLYVLTGWLASDR